jgi:hypothetical protein
MIDPATAAAAVRRAGQAVAPPGFSGPTPEQIAVRKLEHAQHDLSLYAAILGHRPDVTPEDQLPPEPPPLVTISLPGKRSSRRSSSRRSGSQSHSAAAERSITIRLPSFPELSNLVRPHLPAMHLPSHATLAIWVRRFSAVAKKRLEEAKLRLAG